MPSFYLEPCLFAYGNDAGEMHSLAGSSLFFFAAIAIYERDKTGRRQLIKKIPAAESIAFIHNLYGIQGKIETEEQLQLLCQKRTNPLIKKDDVTLMGILNVTPDSFSDGGSYDTPSKAIEHGKKLQSEGADVIDVGGESTRPYAKGISVDDEIKRIKPVIHQLAQEIDIPISIDSRHSATMKIACKIGASIVNDVSALTHDEQSLPFLADTEHDVILMHMQGEPSSMQDNPCYKDALLDVYDYLASRIEIAMLAGIERHRIIIDPGIGFGKSKDHNRELLSHVAIFHSLGCPILIGVSRKKFIADGIPSNQPHERISGSVAAALYAASCGVQMVRIHDVTETRQAINVWRGIVTN